MTFTMSSTSMTPRRCSSSRMGPTGTGTCWRPRYRLMKYVATSARRGCPRGKKRLVKSNTRTFMSGAVSSGGVTTNACMIHAHTTPREHTLYLLLRSCMQDYQSAEETTRWPHILSLVSTTLSWASRWAAHHHQSHPPHLSHRCDSPGRNTTQCSQQ